MTGPQCFNSSKFGTCQRWRCRKKVCWLVLQCLWGKNMIFCHCDRVIHRIHQNNRVIWAALCPVCSVTEDSTNKQIKPYKCKLSTVTCHLPNATCHLPGTFSFFRYFRRLSGFSSTFINFHVLSSTFRSLQVIFGI